MKQLFKSETGNKQKWKKPKQTALPQNHRMFGVGRDLCGSSSPTLLPKQGHLQQAIKAV